MRGIFSGLALLVVLAVIGIVAMKQFKALVPVSAPSGAAASGASPVAVPAQAHALQEQIKLDVNKAIEQGAARNGEAEK